MTYRMNVIIEIHRDITIQADNLILVVRSVERRIPGKLSYKVAGTDRYLKTFVPHLACINLGNVDVRISGGDRHNHIHKHIIRILDISIQTQVDTAVYQGQVGTDIILFHFFPTDIRVRHYRGRDGIHLRTIEIILDSLNSRRIRIIAHTCLITSQAVSCTDFHIAQPETLFKERFFGKSPGKRYGREV